METTDRTRADVSPLQRSELLLGYRRVRERTEQLSGRLSAEDQMLQSMPLCSPTKWHRAHTTWFFETFLLAPNGVPAVDERFGFLFNSYYESLGPRHARPKRGLLSRPSASEVQSYRATVDGRMLELLGSVDDEKLAALAPLVLLGLAHEEQHQELILSDILSAFSESSLGPVYAPEPTTPAAIPAAGQLTFSDFDGGLVEIGAVPTGTFAFDNEGPRHRVWLEPFRIANRLMTVGEMRAFIREGGYRSPSLWLAEGWDFIRQSAIQAPAYARSEGDAYVVFTLHGEREASDAEPVSHLSYFEADALARFLGGRLPTEAEWEHVASSQPCDGHFCDDGVLRPRPAAVGHGPSAEHESAGKSQRRTAATGLFGDVWEWTSSAYAPYPGFRPAAGAVGEYNGKFMVGQMVLRGGSCLTPRGHVRASYRNFWHPDTRFQMSGARLCLDPARGGDR